MRIVVDLQGAQNENRFRGIGRYSMSLARAMCRQAGDHELWFALNGRFPESFDQVADNLHGLLPPDRLRVFDVPPELNQIAERSGWRVHAAELMREQFLAQLRPDIVHVTSWFEAPFDDTVASIDNLEFGIPHAVTLYDLIPLLSPDAYLQDPRLRNWYFRKAQLLRRAKLLLAISKSSAGEARDGLRIPEENIAVIGAGVDEFFRPPEHDPGRDQDLCRRYDLDRPFVLYTGAADARKNLTGLLQAMALLPGELRERYVLACVGKMHCDQQPELVRMIETLGLPERSVRFLGYVPDADLVGLYAMCELFVFPSMHEGFGLPAAEAMACGAPVIGSNTTSVPDVIGRADALFDPTRPDDIARSITSVLTSKAFRDELRAHGIRRARSFDWNDVARRAIEAFEAVQERETRRIRPGVNHTVRQRMAVVARFPLKRGADAGLTATLRAVSTDFDVTHICERYVAKSRRLRAGAPVFSAEWLRNNGGGFDLILYVLRDASCCSFVLPLLERWPGLVLLEDIRCAGLVNGAADYETIRAESALYDSHGLSALMTYPNGATTPPLLCNDAVFRLSDGVLVYEPTYLDIIRRQFGGRAAERMRVVPQRAEIGFFGAAVARLWRGAAPRRPQNQLSGAAVANLWREAVLELSEGEPQQNRKMMQAISGIQPSPQPGDIAKTASALASNTPRFGLPQILVDVSTIAETDARTGVQRVVRSILSELLKLAPEGWRIEPVRVAGESYVYARDFAARTFGLPSRALPPDAPVETRRGDIFLGLDLTAHLLAQSRSWFELQQLRGVSINFVVYDLLPLLRPDLFVPIMAPVFRDWAAALAQMANGVICISRAVAEEFSAWAAAQAFPRRQPLRIGWFHLGADLEASLPTRGLPPDSQAILDALQARRFFLSVGTLEPRKRYGQTLDAFERLWDEGTDVGLAIVGKPGWMTEALASRIENHPELGSRLLWLRGISDEMLDQIYRSATALLAASEGEGFGLPLIEAARHHLPILARDLPVFREIAGDNAAYFSGDDAAALSAAIRNWVISWTEGRQPRSDRIACLTWGESAFQMMDVVLRDRWQIRQNTTEPFNPDNTPSSARSPSPREIAQLAI